MKFSAQLLAERERLGLTQAEAAAVLEDSKSALEKWEYGKKSPHILTQEGALARLHRGLNREITSFLQTLQKSACK